MKKILILASILALGACSAPQESSGPVEGTTISQNGDNIREETSLFDEVCIGDVVYYRRYNDAGTEGYGYLAVKINPDDKQPELCGKAATEQMGIPSQDEETVIPGL